MENLNMFTDNFDKSYNYCVLPDGFLRWVHRYGEDYKYFAPKKFDDLENGNWEVIPDFVYNKRKDGVKCKVISVKDHDESMKQPNRYKMWGSVIPTLEGFQKKGDVLRNGLINSYIGADPCSPQLYRDGFTGYEITKDLSCYLVKKASESRTYYNDCVLIEIIQGRDYDNLKYGFTIRDGKYYCLGIMTEEQAESYSNSNSNTIEVDLTVPVYNIGIDIAKGSPVNVKKIPVVPVLHGYIMGIDMAKIESIEPLIKEKKGESLSYIPIKINWKDQDDFSKFVTDLAKGYNSPHDDFSTAVSHSIFASTPKSNPFCWNHMLESDNRRLREGIERLTKDNGEYSTTVRKMQGEINDLKNKNEKLDALANQRDKRSMANKIDELNEIIKIQEDTIKTQNGTMDIMGNNNTLLRDSITKIHDIATEAYWK